MKMPKLEIKVCNADILRVKERNKMQIAMIASIPFQT